MAVGSAGAMVSHAGKADGMWNGAMAMWAVREQRGAARKADGVVDSTMAVGSAGAEVLHARLVCVYVCVCVCLCVCVCVCMCVCVYVCV